MKFRDYVSQPLNEATVKSVTKKMYKLQDLIKSLENDLMDLDDKDSAPKNYTKFNKTIDAFKVQLETAKTQFRKGE